MHRSLTDLTLRIERTVNNRLLPALYPDEDPREAQARCLLDGGRFGRGGTAVCHGSSPSSPAEGSPPRGAVYGLV